MTLFLILLMMGAPARVAVASAGKADRPASETLRGRQEPARESWDRPEAIDPSIALPLPGLESGEIREPIESLQDRRNAPAPLQDNEVLQQTILPGLAGSAPKDPLAAHRGILPAPETAVNSNEPSVATLRTLSEAPEDAGSRLDGRAAEARAIELFFEANPPPTREQFAAHKNRVAPLIERLYDVQAVGIERLPPGGGVAIANHATLIPHFLIMYAADLPFRFVMDKRIFENISVLLPGAELLKRLPLIGRFVRPRLDELDRSVHEFLRPYVIPVLPRKAGGRKEDNDFMLRVAAAAAERGEYVVIYPEGRRSPKIDANAPGGDRRSPEPLNRFGNGFLFIGENTSKPKFPIAIEGLPGHEAFGFRWASLFGGARRRVAVIFGESFGQLNVPSVRSAMLSLLSTARAAVSETK